MRLRTIERLPWTRRLLHLTTLCGLAIAVPLYIAASAQFYVGRGNVAEDVVALAVIILAGPPLALFAVTALARVLGARAAAAAHLVIVGLLAAILTSEFMLPFDLWWPLQTAIALAGGVGGAIAYQRAQGLRTALSVLVVVPLVAFGLHLGSPRMSQLVFSAEPAVAAASTSQADAPVVLVVFDEFSGYAIMDEHGRLDRKRYPNFARLADDGTWFRNATTPRSDTEIAVPSIFTGRRVALDRLPVASQHPQNLFTLLGGSHDLHVSEPWTDVCPEALCPESSRRSFGERVESILETLPWIHARLWLPDAERLGLPRPRESGEPDRNAQVRRFAAEIEATDRPGLHVLHVLMPHKPWRYLPSGARYSDATGRDGWLEGFTEWGDDPWVAEQGQQRYLAQVGHADRMLGMVLDRLRETGLYDDAMVVVTGDHGVSFRAGERRRDATPETAEDILSVPLFVKLPGQRAGRVDDGEAQNVDVLPTVADALGLDVPWRVDGRSLLEPAPPRRLRIENKTADPVEMTHAEFVRRRDAALRRQVERFGSGDDEPGLYGIGPYRELVGRSPEPLRDAPLDATLALLDGRRLASYTAGRGWVPARIGGTIDGLDPGRPLAVALNGRIAGTTQTYDNDGTTEAAVLVPERVIRPGANELEVFVVEPGDGDAGARLREIGVEGMAEAV